MADPGDIWQRYDAKVMQIQVAEDRLAALERELAQTREERDHWTHVCRDLGKKLSVARTLAERLRTAERVKGGPAEATRAEPVQPVQAVQAGQPMQPAQPMQQVDTEYARAREVLGLVLTALSKALDDDAVAELGRKLRHHAGGKLLHSITRGSLTLVPVDGRYLVDRTWLRELDLGGLRRELDVAAQSGLYTMPARGGELGAGEVDVDVQDDGASDDNALPPPPPLRTADFRTLPPLLSALPDESEVAVRVPVVVPVNVPVVVPVIVPEPARPSGLRAVLIPRLTIDRLIKNPGAT